MPAKTLAIIPARGGSKELPRKNILPVGGRPLIAWTIAAAQGARCIDRLILSSDDAETIAVARALGCEAPFVRPAALATDTATSMEVVRHALASVPGYTRVLLLQPTSPLRTSGDIDGACALMDRRAAPACVSLCPVAESPYWMYRLDESGRLDGLVECPDGSHRRQDLPPVYRLNGAVYVAEVGWLSSHGGFVGPQTVGYLMPAERSLDIDTPQDLACFEALIAAGDHPGRHGRPSPPGRG